MDIVEMVWRTLREEIDTVRDQSNRTALQTERAEYSESIPASTLADAPLAADGGLGNGTSYLTMRWISDGRKPGEGAGNGTGVLAYYSAGGDEWISVFDQNVVST